MCAQIFRTPDRSTLRMFGIALLVLALVAGAGCAGLSDDGGNASDGSNVSDENLGNVSMIDHVPANQDMVIYADTSVTEDETTREFFEAAEDESEEESPSDVEQEDYQEAVNEFEAETGLDIREFDEALFFGQYDNDDVPDSVSEAESQEEFGLVANTGWTTDELTTAIESNDSVQIEQADYQESGVLYRLTDTEESADDQPLYVGVLAEGSYVMGTESTVRGSLDTAYADGDALSGTLRDAYDRTRDGYVRIALAVPEEEQSGTPTTTGDEIAQNMEVLSGAYYTEGDELGFEGRITMSNEEYATQIKAAADILQTQAGQENPEMAEALEPLTVSQEGTDVSFTYADDVESLIELADSN